MNLYKVKKDYKQLQDMIDDNEGLIDDNIQKAIDEYIKKEPSVVIRAVNWIEEQEGLANSYKERAKKLNDMAKSKTNTAERVKKAILEYLVETGRDKIEMEGVTVKVAKGLPKVEITSEEDVPDTYKKVTVKFSKVDLDNVLLSIDGDCNIKEDVDKTLIKEIYKKGLEVNGTRIVTNPSLRIKG